MASREPLVSIGLPVYNGERYLGRALDSLLRQHYQRFELIISDNASQDSTIQICQAYAAKDARVKLVLNDRNNGVIANFTLVLERATGSYFMWAAHDDYWGPEFIAEMVRELETNPAASLAMSSIKRVTESGMDYDLVRYLGKEDPHRKSNLSLAIALANGSPHHLFMYGLFRTDFLKDAFRNFPRVMAGDRLFMIQVALATRLRYVDQMLYVRYMSDEPIPVRYANEEFGKMWQDPRARLKKAFAIGPYLLRSNVVPWRRKLWIPLIVGWPPVRTFLINLYRRMYQYAYILSGKLFGKGGRRKALAKSVMRVLGRISREDTSK